MRRNCIGANNIFVGKKEGFRMKKIILFVSLLLLMFPFGAIAQGVALTIPTVQAAAIGDTVVMHVSVNNFSSVTGIGLNINYDPAVATFAGIANTYAGVSFGVNSATSGVVKMAWVDLTGSASVSISSGVLVDLKFKYKGGSGAVGFTTSDCSISNSSGSIGAVGYLNGSITGDQKPVFTAISPITQVALDTVKFVVKATDPDAGDVLTYSAVSLPVGAKFDTTTRTFSWVPATGQIGSYKVSFLATDGQLKDSMAVSITITKKQIFVKNPIADMTLDDNPISHRTVKIKLSSPPVFVYNMGTLTYSVSSGSSAIVAVSIIAPDTLKVQGLKPTIAAPIRVVLTAMDTDKSTLSTMFMVTVTGPTGVEVNNIPKEFSLSQNYPNPFNPSTSINIGLPVQAPVTMEIYNILGVKVRTLLHGEVMSAGIHQMEWNGKDDAGASVTSGVYLYRINAGTFQVTKKMMMLK
jgi:hypothetical protein